MEAPSKKNKRKKAPVVRQFPPKQGAWNYEAYTHLPDNGMRYEVIGGELFMRPAPRTKHQIASAELQFALTLFVKQHKLGRVLYAPIDVRLPDLADPVQPDILFIRTDNLSIIKDQFIEGIPDLTVEIFSPGSKGYDSRKKFELYAQAGVKEYWMVDPDACTVEIYVLRGEAYALLGQFTAADEAYSEVLNGFSVPVREICAS
ncbi:MAG TPA: Uma2 family endonuclease [Anaerolineales bacterium]|nr:Uma2 family endonuclease [Anaerolineales bacterium]